MRNPWNILLTGIALIGAALLAAPSAGWAMPVAELDELYSESIYAPKGRIDPAPRSFESGARASYGDGEFDALNLVNETTAVEMKAEEAPAPAVQTKPKRTVASRAASRVTSGATHRIRPKKSRHN
ncbi:MAG: hypothetical protein EBX52_00640 [Proteobacteria bacterium]|nr:hypothetical protein [Pseudomonadota bacterium]